MKPLGPIPSLYSDLDGILAVEGKDVRALVNQAGGTPLFVYSRHLIARRVAELRAALPEQIALHYAIKANPFSDILHFLRELVDGFDIASGGELDRVLAAGIDGRLVSFAGPGKRDDELAKAISAQVTLNVESENEAERALLIGEKLQTRPRLAVRVNPDFDLKGSGMKMGGGAKPFGLDADRVPALVRRIVAAGAEWRGFHIYAGSQALAAGEIVETQAQTLLLAARLTEQSGVPCPHLNLGGGFGIPYFPGDKPLDLAQVGRGLAERLADLPAALTGTAPMKR